MRLLTTDLWPFLCDAEQWFHGEKCFLLLFWPALINHRGGNWPSGISSFLPQWLELLSPAQGEILAEDLTVCDFCRNLKTTTQISPRTGHCWGQQLDSASCPAEMKVKHRGGMCSYPYWLNHLGLVALFNTQSPNFRTTQQDSDPKHADMGTKESIWLCVLLLKSRLKAKSPQNKKLTAVQAW